MRSERVETHLRCNQNCTWCDRRAPEDDLAFIQPRSVKERIDRALVLGAEELIITGGEPTLRADLPELVAHAKARSEARVVLETNATQLDSARAARLRDAGLDLARVNLSGEDARLDAATRDAGGFEATLRGLAALREAGVRTEVSITVVASTKPLLPGLPAMLLARLGPHHGIAGIVASVPVAGPAPGELLPFAEAAEAIASLDVAARQHGLSVRLLPGSGPPPCVFPSLPRVAQLFALTPGGAERPEHAYLPECEGCAVRDRCPGVADAQLARFGPPPMAKVTGDRARRRLSIISSVEEQVARELVEPSRSVQPDGSAIEEVLVRVNFHCNQACAFCFVSTHLPAAEDARVRAAIVDAGRRGARVVLSGGEPTLNPRLLEYVSLARSESRHPVCLQTNALRFEDAAFTQAAVAAGVDEVFVSLHGHTAEVSDRVTSAPGTFARTVAGIDQLARTPARLVLNFVICQENFRELPAQVDFIAARWPRAVLCVSFVAPMTDVVPQDVALVPRYSDVRPFLEAALRRANSLGLPIRGFESMCGLPLCAVPQSARQLALAAEVPAGFDRGEFVKTEACQACGVERHCYGVRRRYAALYGTGELIPV